MKKTLRNILVLAALTPFLVQCASQDEVKRLQLQLRMVNKKLENMRSTTVGDIQKRQAASSSQMDQLEREVLSLKGQLEETTMQNEALKEQNTALQTNISNIARDEAEKREEALRRIEEEQRVKEARIADLNEKLQVQQKNLQAIQDARVRDAERRAKEAKRKAQAAKNKALAASSSLNRSSKGILHITADKSKRVITTSSLKPAAPTSTTSQAASQPSATSQKPAAQPTVPAKAAAPGASSTADLSAANQLFKQREYNKALAAYDKIVTANPGSDEAVEANYMMGESLFAQKEYNNAIVRYQNVISKSSTHPKAAAATLKQAMAFEQLADSETAMMIYKKIVKYYGSSPEAIVAKEKLGNM